MLAPMSASDSDLLKQITELVEEEHKLRDSGGEAERIRHLEEQLDQCWDLLRQRQARREFGQADDSEVRSVGTVENYRQ
jgi:Protein of unknown function (DUF2630)